MVAQRAGLRNLPVVGLPPPPSQAGADAGAREAGGPAVPIPPAGDDQGPEQALGQGHKELVSEGDPGDGVPGGCILDAGEIALFEAQVGQGRELLVAAGGLQDGEGNLVLVDVVGQAVEVGVVVEAHGLLGRGSCRRVGVVGRRGVPVD